MLSASAGNAAQLLHFIYFLMYFLMMNVLRSKHVGVIKEGQCFSCLPVAFNSTRTGVYISITNVTFIPT
jgi:hypothetical protein